MRFLAVGHGHERYTKHWTLPLLHFLAAGLGQTRYTKLFDVITMNDADLLDAVMTNLPPGTLPLLCFLAAGHGQRRYIEILDTTSIAFVGDGTERGRLFAR